MFGLPMATILIIVGIPLLWIAYTLIFFFSTRGWSREDVELPDDLGDASPGAHPAAGGAS
ncbi:hypothetical protein [Brevibacterium otitidis]|uniref:Uncharacterized protein n=1 Tax=Brevibacterium otitidis TaxID=53364 RepID=A0ABV5X5B7_9MICO|nr:hypothetical protein GCM10023233_30670 [Brevibacterium otitidis]